MVIGAAEGAKGVALWELGDNIRGDEVGGEEGLLVEVGLSVGIVLGLDAVGDFDCHFETNSCRTVRLVSVRYAKSSEWDGVKGRPNEVRGRGITMEWEFVNRCKGYLRRVNAQIIASISEGTARWSIKDIVRTTTQNGRQRWRRRRRRSVKESAEANFLSRLELARRRAGSFLVGDRGY